MVSVLSVANVWIYWHATLLRTNFKGGGGGKRLRDDGFCFDLSQQSRRKFNFVQHASATFHTSAN